MAITKQSTLNRVEAQAPGDIRIVVWTCVYEDSVLIIHKEWRFGWFMPGENIATALGAVTATLAAKGFPDLSISAKRLIADIRTTAMNANWGP